MIKIISVKKEEMADHGKIAKGVVYSAHVVVDNISEIAREITSSISDTSWIHKLGPIKQASFSARSERTIQFLVESVLKPIRDRVSEEFGEYLISHVAQETLSTKLKHLKVPLAELLKEKVSGNPGFDFHTESPSSIVTFGESKFSSTTSPYTIALNQIGEFIRDKKDIAELVIIESFISAAAADKSIVGKKAYAAAFSVNAKYPETVLKNALGCDAIDPLLFFPEVYLIGIEIDA